MYIPKAKEEKEMTNGWHEGAIGTGINSKNTKVAHYWVKTCDEADELYGIDGGRIIKLQIKVDGRTVVNYDRGWDIEPDEDDETAMIAYSICMKEYN